MNVVDLRDEIVRLKDELENALEERDTLRDEREEMRQTYEKQKHELKVELEKSYQQQLNNIQIPLENKVETLQSQLDLMNRAVTGDPCGWIEKKEEVENEGSRQSIIVYENEETGESSNEIPRVYEFFVLVKKVDQLEEYKAALSLAEIKSKEDDEKISSLFLALEHSQKEAQEYRQAVNLWLVTFLSVKSAMNGFRIFFFEYEKNLETVASDLETFHNRIADIYMLIPNILRVVINQKKHIQYLETRVEKVVRERNTARKRAKHLESFMQDEIAKKVAPIHLDIANIALQMMDERVERTIDNVLLAKLWPDDHVIPSCLLQYQTRDNTISARANNKIDINVLSCNNILNPLNDKVKRENTIELKQVDHKKCNDDSVPRTNEKVGTTIDRYRDEIYKLSNRQQQTFVQDDSTCDRLLKISHKLLNEYTQSQMSETQVDVHKRIQKHKNYHRKEIFFTDFRFGIAEKTDKIVEKRFLEIMINSAMWAGYKGENIEIHKNEVDSVLSRHRPLIDIFFSDKSSDVINGVDMEDNSTVTSTEKDRVGNNKISMDIMGYPMNAATFMDRKIKSRVMKRDIERTFNNMLSKGGEMMSSYIISKCANNILDCDNKYQQRAGSSGADVVKECLSRKTMYASTQTLFGCSEMINEPKVTHQLITKVPSLTDCYFSSNSKLKIRQEIIMHQSRMSNLIAKVESNLSSLRKIYTQISAEFSEYLRGLNDCVISLNDDEARIQMEIRGVDVKLSELKLRGHEMRISVHLHFKSQHNDKMNQEMIKRIYQEQPVNIVSLCFRALRMYSNFQRANRRAIQEVNSYHSTLKLKYQKNINTQKKLKTEVKSASCELEYIQELDKHINSLRKKFVSERMNNFVRVLQNRENVSMLETDLRAMFAKYYNTNGFNSKNIPGGQYTQNDDAFLLEGLITKVKLMRSHLVWRGKNLRLIYHYEINLVKKILKRIRELYSLAIDRAGQNALRFQVFSQMINDEILNCMQGFNCDNKIGRPGKGPIIYAIGMNKMHDIMLSSIERIRSRERNIITSEFSNLDKKCGTTEVNDAGRKDVYLEERYADLQYLFRRERITMTQQIEFLNFQLSRLKAKKQCLEFDTVTIKNIYKQNIGHLMCVAAESINLLKNKILDMNTKFSKQKTKYKKKIGQLIARERQLAIQTSNQLKIAKNKDDLLMHIVKVQRFELSKYRVERETECLKTEKERERHLTETSGLRAQLKMERSNSAILEIMNDFIKKQYRRLSENIAEREKYFENKILKYKSKAHVAQTETRKQRAAAYVLGTNADALFKYFTQRLANLAGSKEEHNDALTKNGAIHVLLAICKCSRTELHAIALKGLSRICWNESVDQRIIGWDVSKHWIEWVEMAGLHNIDDDKKQCTVATTTTNLCRLPVEQLRQKIRQRRRWLLRSQKIVEGPHKNNQLIFIYEKAIIEQLMIFSWSCQKDIVKCSLHGLCAASFSEKAGDHLFRDPKSTKKLVELCNNSDRQISCLAAVIIANMTLRNFEQQESIAAYNGVETLISLCLRNCSESILAGTAALANLIFKHNNNCKKLYNLGGLDLIFRLLKSPICNDLYDADRKDETQANCIECLSSLFILSRECDEIKRQCMVNFNVIILQCASSNISLQMNTPLIIGNIARDANHRREIGSKGAIEALFLLCEKDKNDVRANCLWALSNLAWDVLNQERIGKYINHVIQSCNSDSETIQINAICCLGNMLHYNDYNRAQFNSLEPFQKLVEDLLRGEVSPLVQQMILRVMIALTYDQGFLQNFCDNVYFWKFIKSSMKCSPISEKLSSLVILNLAIHESIRDKIIEEGYVDIFNEIIKDKDSDIANAILDKLKTTKSSHELQKQRTQMDVEDIIHLCSSSDETILKFAFDCLVDQVEIDQTNIPKIIDSEVPSIIMTLCKGYNFEKVYDDILASGIWLLRSVSSFDKNCKDLLGNLGFVEIFLGLLFVCVKKEDCNVKLMETITVTLYSLAITHEENCQRILTNNGVEIIIEISKFFKNYKSKEQNYEYCLPDLLLQMIKYQSCLVCCSCGHKQSIGKTCELCGHSITFITRAKNSREYDDF